MKKLFLLPILLLLLSCSGYDKANQEQQDSVKKTVYKSEGMTGVAVIEVDGCEYVFYKSGYGGGLAHKGNCKNH